MRDYDPKVISSAYVNIGIECVPTVTSADIIEINFVRPFNSTHIIRHIAFRLFGIDK
jgi:hypothetical protein